MKESILTIEVEIIGRGHTLREAEIAAWKLAECIEEEHTEYPGRHPQYPWATNDAYIHKLTAHDYEEVRDEGL